MKSASALLLIALPLALAGCGNKGPLVLPAPQPAVITIEPESGVPVETREPDRLPEPLPDPLLEPAPGTAPEPAPEPAPAGEGGDA